MTKKLPIADCRLPIEFGGAPPRSAIANRQSAIENAFSMVELLVAMTLLSLIVLVLMTVFGSTQRAFRASVTQTDILEGGRAAMDLMSADLRNLTPSDGYYNTNVNVNANFYAGTIYPFNAVNFLVITNSYRYQLYQPLVQSLPGISGNVSRTNVLQYFFVLGRENTKWTAAGYVVDSTCTNSLYPLYRFYEETNLTYNPVVLCSNFLNAIYYQQWTNLSHVMDGVVDLEVRADDVVGCSITNGLPRIPMGQYRAGVWATNQNIWMLSPYGTKPCLACFSNAVPAAVELQLGVLEDRTLQRAASLGIPGTPPPSSPAQWAYLQNQSAHVQVFRQRVAIPNVDSSAY